MQDVDRSAPSRLKASLDDILEQMGGTPNMEVTELDD